MKKITTPRLHQAQKLIQAECAILKQFYQSKGHIILNSNDMVFIFFETVQSPAGNDQEIDEVNILFFFDDRK